MITLDGIQLPDQLVWDDEFAWSPANQQITLTLTGAQFIQESAASGRPISLLHTDKAWITRAALSQLKAKEAQLGLQVVLRFNSAALFLALNKETPDEVVERLQKALDEMRQEGFVEEMTNSYL